MTPELTSEFPLPMGMRFCPSEYEIMVFLLNMVTGSQPLSCQNFIRTADLYGKQEPWEIFGDSEERELYFYTKLNKVGTKKTSQRSLRNVGKGTWSNKGQKKTIYGPRNHVIVGYKRCYRYERKIKDDCAAGVVDDQNGKWLLKEYILSDQVLKSDRVKQEYKDYALCVLKKKGSCSKKTPPPVESGFDKYMFFEAMIPELINNNERARCVGEYSLKDLVQINEPLNDERMMVMAYDLESPVDLRLADDIFGGGSFADDKFEGGERYTDYWPVINSGDVGEYSSGLNEGCVVEINKSLNDERMMMTMPYGLESPVDLRVFGDVFGVDSLGDDKFEGGERCTDDLLEFMDFVPPLSFPISPF